MDKEKALDFLKDVHVGEVIEVTYKFSTVNGTQSENAAGYVSRLNGAEIVLTLYDPHNSREHAWKPKEKAIKHSDIDKYCKLNRERREQTVSVAVPQ